MRQATGESEDAGRTHWLQDWHVVAVLFRRQGRRLVTAFSSIRATDAGWEEEGDTRRCIRRWTVNQVVPLISDCFWKLVRRRLLLQRGLHVAGCTSGGRAMHALVNNLSH